MAHYLSLVKIQVMIVIIRVAIIDTAMEITNVIFTVAQRLARDKQRQCGEKAGSRLQEGVKLGGCPTPEAKGKEKSGRYDQRRKIKEVLMPPKAKLFDCT